MSEILKDCPFCGSNNVEYTFSGSQGFIECQDCEATGSLLEKAADPNCDIDEAFKAWNNRIEPKQLTVNELRAQFEEDPKIKPYLGSNYIMENMIDVLFEQWVQCAKVNNILKERS